MKDLQQAPLDRSAGSIRFVLDGTLVQVHGVSPQTTVLEYLREHRALTGTKEGCAEGDCGACTVVLAELADDGEQLSWRPINACIRFLPTVDGKALFTVRGLKRGGAAHPAQQAMTECHGSQCGFCTPGFVMSLFGLYKNAHRPTRADIDDALSGNLCRCTGYRPIIAAAQRMGELPAPAGVLGPGRGAGGGRIASDEERALAQQLREIARRSTFAYEHGGQRYLAPATTQALADLVAAEPQARIVAGATDVGLWVTKQHRDLGTMIHTGGVGELRAMRRTDVHLEIGAAASLAAAFASLQDEYPTLAEAWTRFASVPIRNSGTLGGNVANGSPIGDSMPVLIALGSEVVLRRGGRVRTLPLEDFYLAYQKTALEAGEIVERLRVPLRDPAAEIRAYKISKRFDQDISAVFACFNLRRDRDGRVAALRIGCGGVAATPARARRCEAALIGEAWTDATIARGQSALDEDFSPLTDMRASAGYRRAVLRNLLLRFHVETTRPEVATRVVEYAGERARDHANGAGE